MDTHTHTYIHTYTHTHMTTTVTLAARCASRVNESTEVHPRRNSHTTIRLPSMFRASVAHNFTLIIGLRRSTKRPSIFDGRHIDHPSSKVDTSIIDPRKSTHRSSIFESRHIDLRRSAHRSSIFEGRHIDLRRSKAETSHPTTQHRTDIPTIRHRTLSETRSTVIHT